MRARELVVAGVRAHLLAAGTATDKAPVILIHGLGASSYSFRHLIPELARDRQVFAPDLPGFGRSDAPADFDYSFMGFARWLESLLLALGHERADFVGNSMGGVTSLRMAMELPARVRRLVLLGTPVYPNNRPMLLWPMRWPVIGALYERALGPWAVRFIARTAFHDPSFVTDELVAEYSLSIGTPGGRRAVAEFLRRAIPPDAEELIARYPAFEHETMIVRGDYDRVVDLLSAERFSRAIKRGRFVAIPSCGHAPQEESPAVISGLLRDFLGTPDGR